MPIQSEVPKVLLYKAVQEAIFPPWFNKMWVDVLFSNGASSISFMEFVGLFKSARMFMSKTATRLIEFD